MFDRSEKSQSQARGGDGWKTWCGAAPWAGVSVPLVEPTGWGHWHIRKGLAELERVRREVEAATAVLVASLPQTRDSTADLARSNGISNREAKRRREIADVAKKMPEALNKLRNGEISPEHLAALAPVKDLEGAEKLLDDASSKSPEVLAKEAEQFKLSTENGDETAKRQWARRSFRWFAASDGMLGFTGLLPPMDGAEFRARLEMVRDAKWRAEHPERADTLGGHGGDTPEQRLADALLHLTGTPCENLSWPTKTAESNGPTSGEKCDDIHNGTHEVCKSHVVEPSTPVSLKTEKRAVVVTFNVDAWQAQILGGGPVPVTKSLFDMARNDLFYAFTNMTGEVLKFGRARRDPTAIQRLVVMVRDQTCVYPGCSVPATVGEVHHSNEFVKDQGTTDTDSLCVLCLAHHHHVHLNDLIVRKDAKGTISIVERKSQRTVAMGP